MLAKRWDVPISHEISLGGHAKTVSCVAVDPSGTRVLTGSVDYKVRLYDFGGMDKHHRSFREIEPEDGHPVVALSFSPGSGDRFLCCTGSAQPQVFTREGVSLLKFNRGDPYVTDMARTSGHVTIVTGGEWHPHENMQCLTSGRDGSVRIWDLCGKTGLRDYLLCDQTIRVRDKAARKCSATCVTYSPDGKRVACGAADGSLQLWQTASATLGRAHNYLRPDARVDSAHSPGTDASGCIISAVSFSPDGHTLASRADDGYVKLWDARKLKTCLASFGGVPAHHATANLAWRPDGAVVCAGTAAPDANSPGALRFFSACGPQHELHQDAGGYKPLISVGVAKGTSVVSVLWHERIRHVFCGTSAGETRVMYDPDLSVKGALVTVRRDHAKRVVGLDSFHIDSASIINPMALPMYRDDSFYKKKGAYSKNRNDPIKSKKPAPPLESGQQGRNTGGRSTFCQFYIENNLPASIRGDDPRAELLKYADKEPIFRTEATFYRDKEGKQLMDTETLEAAQSKFVDDQKKLLDRTGRK
ncbi:WD40-repeat-containing domain protein [Pelagophyceae sp. CCMP2097]|nr:WD40-repeat-containing domain protein [Pelagophyceae sp. CCMP2097]